MNTNIAPEDHILPADSIQALRYAVFFEGQWLWEEKDPVCRMNMAKRLAELTAQLADLEAQEVQRLQSEDA